MPSLARWIALAGCSATLLALTAVGCHSSSAGAAACNADPWQCATGQTCWPQACTCPSGQSCDATNCTPQFQCIDSAPAQQGDSCALSIGTATCGDGLTCFELANGESGACRAYCDPTDSTRGCVFGFSCQSVSVGNSTALENICVPVLDQDAALGGDSGSGDDASYYDPDALPDQPDVTVDGGQVFQ